MAQRSRDRHPLPGLAMLFGGALLAHGFEGDLTELNRCLPFPPNGKPFKQRVNPRGYAGYKVPDHFGNIIRDGAWPDTWSYIEPELGSSAPRFNLYRRVCAHLPWAGPWLFPDLYDLACGVAVDLRRVQEGIARNAAAFGLVRLNPLAGLEVVKALGQHGLPTLLQAQWGGLAAQGTPTSVALLTLVRLEQAAERGSRIFEPYLEPHLVRAWTYLLRTQWIREAGHRGKAIRGHIRELLAYLHQPVILSPPAPPTEAAHLTGSCSFFYVPTLKRNEAIRIFMEHYGAAVMDILGDDDKRPIRRLRDIKPRKMPPRVEEAFHTILDALLTASSPLPSPRFGDDLLPPAPIPRKDTRKRRLAASP